MNPIVVSSYNLVYVGISFLLAVVGSYVALTATTRIRRADGSLNITNVVSAGTALGGIGVWAMHFMGMLALNLDLASSYSMVETGVSLIAAVIATSMALSYVARAPKKAGRLLVAGFLLGMGVVVMHYLGMYGMRINGFIQWDYVIVGASMLIAVVAATAALWLAFNTQGLTMRLLAALIMGIAVCAMHYTGMSAAEFICTTENRMAIPQGFGYVSALALPSLVTIVSMTLLFVIAIDQFFQSTGKSAPRAVAR
jgi:NO-binding membrane sensor protein with MHYT domain